MQTKKNILILTYWSYKDALIQTYTLPYVRIIRKIISGDSKIFLVTFENKFHSITSAETAQIKQQLADENIFWISYSYTPLGVISFLKNIFALAELWWFCVSKKITHIHAWCTPAGSFGYILSEFTGIPLIIDSYEPHAESMVENGTWEKKSLAFKLLFWLEKLQSQHGKFFIAASHGMNDYAKAKYRVELKEYFVKPACVDLNLFSEKNKKRDALIEAFDLKNKIICVYAGKIGGIYLEHEIFDFFKCCLEFWTKEKFRVIFLSDTPRSQIESMCHASGLNSEIVISMFASHEQVPLYIGLADFAINPVKPVPSKRYCTSIKDGEYWAMGLPVVITNSIQDDVDIIEKNNIGFVLKEFSREEYQKAVKKIDYLLKNSETLRLRRKIRSIAEIYRHFRIAEKVYRNIYQKFYENN